MKLEVGKYYRTRDGRKAGPLESSDNGDAGGYYIKDYGLIKPDGRFGYGYYGWSSDLDLVAEWVDEPEHESGQSGAQTHTSPLSAWVKHRTTCFYPCSNRLRHRTSLRPKTTVMNNYLLPARWSVTALPRSRKSNTNDCRALL